VATSPRTPPYTPKVACINSGMWGHVLDVINHAKCQLHWFMGFTAPSGRKSLSPIDWRYRPYNSVRTKVLHCDGILNMRIIKSILTQYLAFLSQCLHEQLLRQQWWAVI